MDLKQIAKDTSKTIISYLTYQAVRTVMSQLSETNPPLALWLHRFSSTENIQDGEAYIRSLFLEQQELAFRILTVREHIIQEVVEFIPEMVQTGIQQANMEHRRYYLERMTQMDSSSLPQLDHPPDSDSKN